MFAIWTACHLVGYSLLAAIHHVLRHSVACPRSLHDTTSLVHHRPPSCADRIMWHILSSHPADEVRRATGMPDLDFRRPKV